MHRAPDHWSSLASNACRIWLATIVVCMVPPVLAQGPGEKSVLYATDAFAWEYASSKRAIDSMASSIEAPEWNVVEDLGDVLRPEGEEALILRLSEFQSAEKWKVWMVTCRYDDMLLQAVKAGKLVEGITDTPAAVLLVHASGMHLSVVCNGVAAEILPEARVRAWLSDQAAMGNREPEVAKRFVGTGKEFARLITGVLDEDRPARVQQRGVERVPLAYAGLKSRSKGDGEQSGSNPGIRAKPRSPDLLEVIAYWTAGILVVLALAGLGLRMIFGRRLPDERQVPDPAGAIRPIKRADVRPPGRVKITLPKREQAASSFEDAANEGAVVKPQPRLAPPVALGTSNVEVAASKRGATPAPILSRLIENAELLSVVPPRLRGAILESMTRQIDKMESKGPGNANFANGKSAALPRSGDMDNNPESAERLPGLARQAMSS
jgi:hypothetical protein